MKIPMLFLLPWCVFVWFEIAKFIQNPFEIDLNHWLQSKFHDGDENGQ